MLVIWMIEIDGVTSFRLSTISRECFYNYYNHCQRPRVVITMHACDCDDRLEVSLPKALDSLKGEDMHF